MPTVDDVGPLNPVKIKLKNLQCRPVRPSPTESFQRILDQWGGGANGLNPHNK